jgi:hypothetical protein
MSRKAKICEGNDPWIMHGEISRLNLHYITFRYLRRYQLDDPDTWLLGFRTSHTRFTTYFKIDMEETSMTGTGLWVQSWSFGNGPWSSLSLI